MGKRICVYCSSSSRIAPEYYEAAAQFARLASQQGHCLVCGGSCRGLMGELIRSSLDCGGEIEGIIPEFMRQIEWEDKRLERLTIVDTMHERKQLLMQDADAIVALPGGIGTLEELSEALCLKTLGKIGMPIIIFNQEGFYNSLLEFFAYATQEQMIDTDKKHAWTVANTVEEIFEAISSAPVWNCNIKRHLN